MPTTADALIASPNTIAARIHGFDFTVYITTSRRFYRFADGSMIMRDVFGGLWDVIDETGHDSGGWQMMHAGSMLPREPYMARRNAA